MPANSSSLLKLTLAVILAGSPLASSVALTIERDPRCGSAHQTSGVGPFDYRDKRRADVLKNVEHYHFSREIERIAHRGSGKRSVLSGKRNNVSSVGIRNTLDYALRAFPNHPRVLRAMSVYTRKRGDSREFKKKSHCYFQRAVEFVPDDMTVWLLYAIHLFDRDKIDQAIDILSELVDQGSRDPEVHYNLGLFYLKKKRYADALDRAHSALALGYPMPGLARKLKKAGHWKDPQSAAGHAQ